MLEILEKDGKIYSHIRKKWLVKTPEEIVRQNYLLVLVNDYGYSIDLILEEENLTGRGSAQARADFVVYQKIEDIINNNNPLIIVECKADNIVISEKDYLQGELYARMHNAQFFVTHNSIETKFWRVKKDKSPGYREEIENIPHVNASVKEIQDLYKKLKVFRQGEFKTVLKACHDVIRDNEKLDPSVAFDEIAKILFMKVYAERHLKSEKQNVFSLEWVENAEKYTKDFIQVTFNHTKTEFGKSVIFKQNERINLSDASIKTIIHKLEKYNLSETAVDTKGIAFENFLGDTFRGSLGQFFTPRPVVDFMIDIIDPQENQLVCDPACGSGGFLIRFFQKVHQRIIQSLNDEYIDQKEAIDRRKDLSEAEKAVLILELFQELERKSDIKREDSRLYHLANRCIFGVDANDRAARTAKMNMIMHGDGHGGIHHYKDGLLNIPDTPVQDGSFDVILTNPPFGMKTTDKNILKLFQLSKNKDTIVTQILFLERCLNMLKAGGKLAILLPNGVFNNPKDRSVREFAEDNGHILATVMLPRETFLSSNADVNCSLLFMQKFTPEEAQKWQNILRGCQNDVLKEQKSARKTLNDILENKISPKDFEDKEAYRLAAETLKIQKNEAKKRLSELETELIVEGRKRSRTAFNYPIFMGVAAYSGITATGDTGGNVPNDLTAITTDYQLFIEGKSFKSDKSIVINYEALNRWDGKHFKPNLQSNFTLKKLKSYIYEHSNKINLPDFPEDTFSILGVTNQEGVYLNLTEKGSHFNQPYKKVKGGELTYNPYRINVGSIGIVPNAFDGFYISPAYVVFGVKDGLLAEYLYLVLSSDWYNETLRGSTSGSVRENLTYDLLEELDIPMPDIATQKRIVDDWKTIEEAKKQLKNRMEQFSFDLEKIIVKN